MKTKNQNLSILFIDTFEYAESLAKYFRAKTPLSKHQFFHVENEKLLIDFIFKSSQIDLIILEPMMLDSFLSNKKSAIGDSNIGPGIYIYKRIKEMFLNREQPLKIMILSTHSEVELYKKGFPENQDCIFLKKPILPEDFMEKIEEILDDFSMLYEHPVISNHLFWKKFEQENI